MAAADSFAGGESRLPALHPKFTPLRWRGQLYIRSVVAGLSHLARERRRAVTRLGGALSNLEVARYFWYWSYLDRTASSYRNVMPTDVRDVLFLGQPFDFEIRDDACFFLEDERWRSNT